MIDRSLGLSTPQAEFGAATDCSYVGSTSHSEMSRTIVQRLNLDPAEHISASHVLPGFAQMVEALEVCQEFIFPMLGGHFKEPDPNHVPYPGRNAQTRCTEHESTSSSARRGPTPRTERFSF